MIGCSCSQAAQGVVQAGTSAPAAHSLAGSRADEAKEGVVRLAHLARRAVALGGRARRREGRDAAAFISPKPRYAQPRLLQQKPLQLAWCFASDKQELKLRDEALKW